MNRILLRLSTAAALMLPVGALGVVAAPAAASGTSCTENSGSVTFSPGLTSMAKVQNIVVHASLGGCTGSTVSSATYVAKLKSSQPVTCASLAVAGETATGSVVVKWSPKGQGNSVGTLTLTATGSEATFGGMVESGLFTGSSFAGSAESFTPIFKPAGEPCSKKNPLKKATFSGSGVTIS